MSAQKPVQSDDPIELLADSMNVWVGKLSDIVHKVIDTEPIRNVINWARMYSLWPVNITTACCSAEFGAASGARHDLERFGVLPYGSLRQSDLIVIEGTITKKMAKRLRMIYDHSKIGLTIHARFTDAMGGSKLGYLCSSRCLVYCDNTLCDIQPSAIPSRSRHS